MAAKISTILPNLKAYQIKGIKFDGINDKGGTICQTTEAGEEFNIIRWLIYKYTLSLQYLTFEEAENIIKELIKIKNNRSQIIISKQLIDCKGYIDFKEVKGDPIFSFDLKDISPKQNVGKPYYDLTIKLNERVDIL